jgi:HD-like signal output (HDOD) protein/signal transduction histidine kinase
MDQPGQDIRNRLLLARLPAMPQILLKLIDLCQTDEAGLAEVAELVAKDPGLASKILAVANSSAYHRSGGRVGIEQSLMTLGTDTIKTLVISESVFHTFNNFSHSSSTDLRSFWKHSLTVAVMARDIAKRIDYPHIEEAYLAGLLHDVGRLALLAVAGNEYGPNFLAQDDDNLCAVELQTLQITHAEAGAWLIERWRLDSFLADSVLYHHEPIGRLQAAHPLIRIILLANFLSNHQPFDQDDPALEAAAAFCGIKAGDLEAIDRGAVEQVRKSADFLGIDLTGADQMPAPAAYVPPPAETAAPPVSVQGRLADQVRNLVLASEAGRSFAREADENGLLEAATRSARLLFGLDDALILLMNDTGHALIGMPVGSQHQRLAQFSIPVSSVGAIAATTQQKDVVFIGHERNQLGIAEAQLLRVLDAECLVCVPLIAGRRCRGVLIGGVSSWQVADLRQREQFMLSFGSQLASAIDSVKRTRNEADSQAANVSEHYRETSRKLAHEVNNPLSIIKNYLGVLDDKVAKQAPLGSEMTIINEEIARVGDIVNEFAGLQPALPEGGIEVNRVIHQVVRLFRDSRFMPPAVQIVGLLPDQPCLIAGSPDTLKQILINLIKNAIEAVPQGGAIEVANNGHVHRDGRLYLELSVRDTGPGLPEAVLAHLFSPVQSSKGGSAHGFGLSIVHGLVKKMQGTITCRSGKKGTTFELLLPVRNDAGQVPGVPATAPDCA